MLTAKIFSSILLCSLSLFADTLYDDKIPTYETISSVNALTASKSLLKNETSFTPVQKSETIDTQTIESLNGEIALILKQIGFELNKAADNSGTSNKIKSQADEINLKITEDISVISKTDKNIH